MEIFFKSQFGLEYKKFLIYDLNFDYNLFNNPVFYSYVNYINLNIEPKIKDIDYIFNPLLDTYNNIFKFIDLNRNINYSNFTNIFNNLYLDKLLVDSKIFGSSSGNSSLNYNNTILNNSIKRTEIIYEKNEVINNKKLILLEKKKFKYYG